MNPETKLQNEIREAGTRFFHPYAISMRANSGKARSIASERRIALAKKGTEDTVWLVGGLYVALEVKMPGKKLSPAQKDRKTAVETAGGVFHRVDSVPGAVAALADALETSPLARSSPDLVIPKIKNVKKWLEKLDSEEVGANVGQ